METPQPEPTADTQQLTTLPTEILNHIFMWLDPVSLMTTSKVCRLLYNVIKGNQSLCRNVYLLRMVRIRPTQDLSGWVANGLGRTSRMIWT